jgi:hypothetical protein
MMSDPQPAATNLSGIAAVLQAIAWPLVAIFFLLIYRSRIGLALDVISQKIREAKHLKAGQVEIDTAEAISKVANQVAESASVQDVKKEIPETQIEAARVIGEKLKSAPIGTTQKVDLAERSINALIDEYEKTRREMRSGPARTRAMDEITAKIRAYAIAARPLLPSLVQGSRPGERLTAICILQVRPEVGYFYWLVGRIMEEDQAFLLFHASLAILALVKTHSDLKDESAAKAVRAALDHVKGYSGGGGPDPNTVDVLNEVLSRLGR